MKDDNYYEIKDFIDNNYEKFEQMYNNVAGNFI